MALSENGKKLWQKEIALAHRLIENMPPVPDEEYKIELDPEDFLDLINGKWSAYNAEVSRA